MFNTFKNLFEESEFNKKQQGKAEQNRQRAYEQQFRKEQREEQERQHRESSRQRQSSNNSRDSGANQQQSSSSQNHRQQNSNNQRKSHNTGRNQSDLVLQQALEFFGFASVPSKSELKRQYKVLSNRFHPDKPTGDAEKMKRLNEYRALIAKYIV